jgi:hypothetical protein
VLSFGRSVIPCGFTWNDLLLVLYSIGAVGASFSEGGLSK